MAPRYIKIYAQDGITFIIPREVAMVSGTWKNMLNSESYLESQTGELTFDETSDILSVIIDYLYYNLEYQETNGQPSYEFDFPPEMSLQLLIAADYLNV